jgi:hypothetical protein
VTAIGGRGEFGVRLRAEREARRWGKRQMARELLRAIGAPPERKRIDSLSRQMLDWEGGKHFPRDWTSAYAKAFGLNEGTLFGEVAGSLPGVSLEATVTSDDWDDMERRRLLLAALGVGTGALSTGEPIRQLLDLAVDSEVRAVGDWGLACADHLHALRTRPPATVCEGVVVDLLALHRQLQIVGAKEIRELQRVVAVLGFIHANALTRVGDHGAAIRWWRTAKAAADASDDLELRLMVRCEEAGSGLYGQRHPSTVLHLVEVTRGMAGSAPSFWLADLAGTEAKALSLLGRPEEARQALRTFAEWEGGDGRARILPTSPWSFKQVQFAQSWVYSQAGAEAESDRARDAVLGGPANYQYVANVQLHAALCTVMQGGIDQGVRRAAAVLDALPASHQSQMITETGRMVLQAVPIDQRQRPAVGELCEVLSLTAPRPPAALSG